jgi:hypothetical protein
MYRLKDKSWSGKRGWRSVRARIISWPAHSCELFSVKSKQLRDVRARKTSVFQTMLHGLAKLFWGGQGRAALAPTTPRAPNRQGNERSNGRTRRTKVLRGGKRS